MNPSCRTCLREIIDDNLVALTEDTESLRIKNELSLCVPEIVVDTVANPVMCLKCVHALDAAYKFKTQCLQSEVYINNYVKNINSNMIGQNLEISSLDACVQTPINKCSKPSIRDIIDELNNLLDEALQRNAPEHCEILENKIEAAVEWENPLEQGVTAPQEIPENDGVSLQNNEIVKECFIRCERIPDSVVNSVRERMLNAPATEVTTNKKHVKLLKGCKCTCQFSVKKNLELHKKIHISEELLVCNTCNYSCVDKGNLRQHIMIHMYKKKLFNCKMCPYRGGSKQALDKHTTALHSSENPREITIKPYVCKVCFYSTFYQKCLNKHIVRYHRGKYPSAIPLKPYVCKVCFYKTCYSKYLKKHISRYHSDKNQSISEASGSQMNPM